jgi:hypothetical protein
LILGRQALVSELSYVFESLVWSVSFQNIKTECNARRGVFLRLAYNLAILLLAPMLHCLGSGFGAFSATLGGRLYFDLSAENIRNASSNLQQKGASPHTESPFPCIVSSLGGSLER